MDRNIFADDGKTGIQEIDTLFERKPIDVVLKDSLDKKLLSVRTDPEASDLIILPKEELGENWMKSLGLTQDVEPYLVKTDPEDPEISVSISGTNIPEVFLKERYKLNGDKVTVFKTLMIQKDKPTSI